MQTVTAPPAPPAPPAAGVGQQGRWGFGSGVVSGVLGLGLAEGVAALVAPVGSPLHAVGSAVIDLLPGPLVNFGKSTLGLADKPVLLAILAVAVVALCGLAGWLERRREYAGVGVFGPLAFIAESATLTRANSTPLAVLPAVAGLLAGYVLLRALVARLRRWQSPHRGPDATAIDRRDFLRLLGGGAVVAVGVALGARALEVAAAGFAKVRGAVRLPAPTATASVPAGADLHVKGLTPYVSLNDGFYRIDTALAVPQIDPAKWSLRVTGLVDNPVELSFPTLLSKPLVEHLTTLTCVSNEVGGNLAGNARWLGWPIRELLAEARPRAGADMVLSRSEDGFTAGTPLSALTDPNRQALLAVGMNGEPLPPEHGFPVRMVVPGLYGYVSATKWVTELKVTTFAADQGYWTPLGWSARGPVKLASRIDTPGSGRVAAGRIAVAGVAWAQHTGIGKVEVQVDDGPWQTATLAATAGPDTWRQWVWRWGATPGQHRLRVRATDADGHVQTEQVAPPEPDGATGWHTVEVTVP